MGQPDFPPRRLLTPEVSAALAEAHTATGRTFGEVARLIGIDPSYWRRLTVGERCPSRPVALRIIEALGLNDELAERLLDESKPPPGW